jgi:trehalose-6-phosphate synthase
MAVEERRARYETMMAQLRAHDVHTWRDAFLEALQRPDRVFAARAPMAAE